MHTQIEHTINTRLFSLLDMLKIIDRCLQFLLLLQQGVQSFGAVTNSGVQFWEKVVHSVFFNIFTDILT